MRNFSSLGGGRWRRGLDSAAASTSKYFGCTGRFTSVLHGLTLLLSLPKPTFDILAVVCRPVHMGNRVFHDAHRVGPRGPVGLALFWVA